MKPNEAPEKLYCVATEGGYYLTAIKSEPPFTEAVEYVRTDAFIEKACEFLKSYRQDTCDGMAYIPGIVNDKTIEDFRKYMKGE